MKKKLTDKQKLDLAIEEFRKIANDPETIKRAEKLHKKLSHMTAEDWFREFTI
ncbi:MAG: hypothetical protein MUO73_09435 [Thermoplasmata archaeon]|nr:hypothetical protein [Thermoplasmata archaeon]